MSVVPWFVNDRGQQVSSVVAGDGRSIGWFAPHPCGFYGSRDAWPCGTIEATRPTEAAIVEWIAGATVNPTRRVSA
mgnify:CR=1 FL=1